MKTFAFLLFLVIFTFGFGASSRGADRPADYQSGLTLNIAIKNDLSLMIISFNEGKIVQAPNLPPRPDDEVLLSFDKLDSINGDVQHLSIAISLDAFGKLLVGGEKKLESAIVSSVLDGDGGVLISAKYKFGIITFKIDSRQLIKLKKWISLCDDLKQTE